MRHLAVADLWVQQCAKKGEVCYKKIDGTRNPPDIMTKVVEAELIRRHLATLGLTNTEHFEEEPLIFVGDTQGMAQVCKPEHEKQIGSGSSVGLPTGVEAQESPHCVERQLGVDRSSVTLIEMESEERDVTKELGRGQVKAGAKFAGCPKNTSIEWPSKPHKRQ